MEFSFDRSKDSHLRKPDNTSMPQGAQASESSNVRPGPDLNSVDPSTIANERLRKAIERNRAKQAAANSTRPQSTQSSSGFTQEQAEQYHQQSSLFAHQEVPAFKAAHAERVPPSQPDLTSQQGQNGEAPRARERLSSRLNTATRQAARESMREAASEPAAALSEGVLVSRRSVAKPEDTEFVPVKRTPKKVASQISYTTNSTRKKVKSIDPKYISWLVKGSWVFCGIMVLRLIFATGGVTDYYSQKSSVNDRLIELNEIKKENMQLVRDIERMKTDFGFQKKLVRDNLGFIAADEFLVLFPKEK